MNEKFKTPTKEQVAKMYLSINDEVGTSEYVDNDPFRHSLALMEIMQTLLKMQIEVKQARLERPSNEKLKVSDERLARLLKLTIHLDAMADMNDRMLFVIRDLKTENEIQQRKIIQLENEIQHHVDAMEYVEKSE